jgi:hypothetical protein
LIRNRPIYRLKVADRYGRNVTRPQAVAKKGEEFGVERTNAWSSDVRRKVRYVDKRHQMWLKPEPGADETRSVEEAPLDTNERIIETDLISFGKAAGILPSNQKPGQAPGRDAGQ